MSSSSQHTELLRPFVDLFQLRIDHDLKVMQPNQSPAQVCSRVLAAIGPIFESERPDLVLVQGDTTTALAGALAGFYHRLPVGHVEAGLRSENDQSPFPEEMNRRLIGRLASYHFAPTSGNVAILQREGVDPRRIFLTGNPIVDAVRIVLAHAAPDPELGRLLTAIQGKKPIVLTTHRREAFGARMRQHLTVLREFVERHDEMALVFPVHPNPMVREAAHLALGKHPRIFLTPPLDYPAFLLLLSRAWIIVSDSGGVQEEAPTLRKPLLVLRENTERPEALQSGVARLVGPRPEHLMELLEEAYTDGTWICDSSHVENPFGQGDSGRRIAAALAFIARKTEVNSNVSTREDVTPFRSERLGPQPG